jgi:hypothetical protein
MLEQKRNVTAGRPCQWASDLRKTPIPRTFLRAATQLTWTMFPPSRACGAPAGWRAQMQEQRLV